MYLYNILVAYSAVWVQNLPQKSSAIISTNYPAKWSDTPLKCHQLKNTPMHVLPRCAQAI